MRLSITMVATVLSTAVMFPATAAAAPNRSNELKTIGSTQTWSSDVATGAVYGSPIDSRVPHCSALFSCDTTLVKSGEYGDLAFSITGKGVNGQATLDDIDLHVYESDASGTQGDLLGESTSAAADEGVSLIDAEPGYYLVLVDWYLGVGSYDATAQLLEPTPDDEF